MTDTEQAGAALCFPTRVRFKCRKKATVFREALMPHFTLISLNQPNAYAENNDTERKGEIEKPLFLFPLVLTYSSVNQRCRFLVECV